MGQRGDRIGGGGETTSRIAQSVSQELSSASRQFMQRGFPLGERISQCRQTSWLRSMKEVKVGFKRNGVEAPWGDSKQPHVEIVLESQDR